MSGTATTPPEAPTAGVTICALRGGCVTSHGSVQPGRLATATAAALDSPAPCPPAHWMSQPAATALSCARLASLRDGSAAGLRSSTFAARRVR
ncbi:hypothetical protein GCM10020219_078810 [Nonomuraea dietziae]